MLPRDASGGATKASLEAERPLRSARLEELGCSFATGEMLMRGAGGGVWSEKDEEEVEGEGPGLASMTAMRRLLLPFPGEKGEPGG